MGQWRMTRTARFGVGVEPVATQPPVPAPSGGSTVDTEARAAIAALSARLVEFGLIEAAPAVDDQPAPARRPRPQKADA